MPRRPIFTALVVLLLGPGALHPAPPYASKTAVSLSPGSLDKSPSARAVVMARHGEWSLALNALRLSSRVETDLAASVLTRMGRFAAAESLLARHSADPEDGFMVVRRARLLADAGRHADALRLLTDAKMKDDAPFAPYRDVLTVREQLALDNPEAAEAVLTRLRGSSPPPALSPWIETTSVSVLRATGKREGALAATAAALDAVTDPATVRDMLLARFELASQLRETKVAHATARTLFNSHQRSQQSVECAHRLVSADDAQRLDDDLLLDAAFVFQSTARAAELKRTLRVLDARTLAGRAQEIHRVLWAEYHFINRDYSRAIALARPSYAEPDMRRRSLLITARSFRRADRALDAAPVYEMYASAFPNDGLAPEALYTAASIYRQAGRTQDSGRVLDQLRRSYPETFHGWAAAMERAAEHERGGRAADALAIYEQWLARSKRSDEAALYYLARHMTSAGHASRGALLLDELRRVNPYSFYARPDVASWSRDPVRPSTASEPADLSLGQWLAACEIRREQAYRNVAGDSTGDARTPPAARAALERGTRFLSAGFEDWAETELAVAQRLSGGSAREVLSIARLYDEHAMPWKSVRLYERARAGMAWQTRREHAEDFRYLTHPIPFPAQVLDASTRSKVAPHLVYGLIREESRFETEAVSRAGAVGLMQLMPETARAIARRLDLPSGASGNLDEPEVNVAIGTWYAADLLRGGKGSVTWMLAAYNAGPGAAARWIEPGSAGDDAIRAVERIDYKETRAYVKRVVESANVYHDLYFGGAGSGAPR